MCELVFSIDFNVLPVSQTINENEVAEFMCQARDLNLHISWRVNGTEIIAGSTSSDVTIGTSISSNGTVIDTLMIVGSSHNNGTVIECVALQSFPITPMHISPPVLLIGKSVYIH